MSSNKNNGLITKLWGPPAWEYLHSVSFGYPLEPTDEQKKNYRNFFINVGNTLPCKFCRNSYNDFIVSNDTKLNDDDLKNRENLTRWLYRMHEKVNNKLNITYNTTYEQLVNRYESYRSKCGKIDKKKKGCVTPLDSKAMSYNIQKYRETPSIPYKLARSFCSYAKKRGLKEKDFIYMNNCLQNGGYENLVFNKKSNKCIERNNYCRNIIQNMREKGIPSIVEEGEHEGYPSIEELKLIMALSTNLCEKELVNIKNKLGRKKYILKK
tara:strand:- start:53 stop:853 length:801 start_codon:yes stop_codon:yes gene_type:complete